MTAAIRRCLFRFQATPNIVDSSCKKPLCLCNSTFMALVIKTVLMYMENIQSKL
jgi:hypothetical protein